MSTSNLLFYSTTQPYTFHLCFFVLYPKPRDCSNLDPFSHWRASRRAASTIVLNFSCTVWIFSTFWPNIRSLALSASFGLCVLLPVSFEHAFVLHDVSSSYSVDTITIAPNLPIFFQFHGRYLRISTNTISACASCCWAFPHLTCVSARLLRPYLPPYTAANAMAATGKSQRARSESFTSLSLFVTSGWKLESFFASLSHNFCFSFIFQVKISYLSVFRRNLESALRAGCVKNEERLRINYIEKI